MEWIDQLNEAIEYIESHLTEEVEYKALAKIAKCSTYHFQRMFSYVAGVSLSEYIRRRRMSLAATRLQESNAKVLDVALHFGYDSPTAFNRAFQSVHGIPPSKVKKEGTSLKAYPPIRFQLTIKGDVEMNYKILKKDAFRVVGVSEPLDKVLEKNFESVPAFWQKVSASGDLQRLLPLMNGEPMGILGVSACGDDENWRYYIGVANDQDSSFEEYTVPAATWAVFTGEGPIPNAIQQLEQRIISEWLPTSGYEYGIGPDIEVYLNADPRNAQFEVWIPVVKK